MTICIATDGFPPATGGIASFNGHLSGLLTEAGHQVIVLLVDFSADDGQPDTVTNENGITVVRLKNSYYFFYNQWKRYFKPGGFDAANWIATGVSMHQWLVENHRNFSIEIIEASDFGGAGAFLCDKNLPPVVITGHGSLLQLAEYQYEKTDTQSKIIHHLEIQAYRHADAVIVHSPLNRDSHSKKFNRSVNLCLMPWRNNGKVPGQLTTTGKMIVVGGLQPVKGIEEMIRTMELLRSDSHKIQLDWIGPDTWLAPGYKKMSEWLAQEYPAVWNRSFKWRGALSSRETAKEIAGADIVLIPSAFDTFGYIALEAAQLRKPLIITRTTGAAYLFNHGTDAWIVPSNEPTVLKTAIEKLATDHSLCKLLGENAAEMVNRKFTHEKIVSDRMAVYEGVIRNRVLQNAPSPLDFLKSYRSPWRKYYYFVRGAVKRMLGKGV